MTDYQLLNQIDELVASKTFNLDALDGIKKLKDDLKKTLEERDALQKKYDDLVVKHRNAQDEIEQQKAVSDALRADLKASRELNAAGQKAIYEAEKHKAVAEAWQGAMQTVFKPNTVRETVYQSMPIAHNYNGNTSVVPYQQETKTTKEEL
jgi:chromosome segregation ATPase